MHKPSLFQLRKRIDSVDNNILKLLSERMQLAREVGIAKKSLKVIPLQPARWQVVLQNRTEIGEKLGLRSSFVREVWENIHEESLHIQENI